MDWKRWYADHICTAREAVKRIPSHSRVVVAHATGEPSHLLDAMVANAAQYEAVELIHMVAMGKAAYCQPQYAKHFRHNSFFLGASTRAAAAEGRADFTPVYFSEIPALLEKGDRRLTGPTMPPQGLYMNRLWYPDFVLADDGTLGKEDEDRK